MKKNIYIYLNLYNEFPSTFLQFWYSLLPISLISYNLINIMLFFNKWTMFCHQPFNKTIFKIDQKRVKSVWKNRLDSMSSRCWFCMLLGRKTRLSWINVIMNGNNIDKMKWNVKNERHMNDEKSRKGNGRNEERREETHEHPKPFHFVLCKLNLIQ